MRTQYRVWRRFRRHFSIEVQISVLAVLALRRGHTQLGFHARWASKCFLYLSLRALHTAVALADSTPQPRTTAERCESGG